MYIDHQKESAKRLPQDWKHIYCGWRKHKRGREREDRRMSNTKSRNEEREGRKQRTDGKQNRQFDIL